MEERKKEGEGKMTKTEAGKEEEEEAAQLSGFMVRVSRLNSNQVLMRTRLRS